MNIKDIPLQPASLDIWEKKYQLIDKSGTPVDTSIDDTFKRVAKELASVEPTAQDFWEQKFMWALNNGALPAGRILSNAGATQHKSATSTINCTVSGTIEDSMLDVLTKNLEAGMTLKAGCGIGYEFSTLRPRGAYVAGAGASTSGPLSFMDIFDKTCFTVSSAGGRRGAQMATFDIHHPDVLEFIKAKREDGRLRQFNLSLLITNDFIRAVKNKELWHLSFPLKRGEKTDKNIIWRKVPNNAEYETHTDGTSACAVYDSLPAEQLWNLIMSSTYDFAEPGFILIDEVNAMNNNWYCEDIRATNPCGEQPLPPYGSCLLGSINLTRFVKNPFTPKASFDWDTYEDVVGVFTRMLDNVVEINGLPLEGQRDEIIRKRRHGMGFLGLGSTMTMLCMKYGSPASLKFTEQVSLRLAMKGWESGAKLAEEKGCAPLLQEKFTVTKAMLDSRPELKQLYEVDTPVRGKDLMLYGSRYLQNLFSHSKRGNNLFGDLMESGSRFTHHSSIAPTGTISLSLGNNASNGIEPTFAHAYSRNVIRSGKKTKEKVDVLSFEFLAYKALIDPYATVDTLPDYFVTTDNIHPLAHIEVQAAAQKWIDSSISKTANVPTDYPFEDFKDIYMTAVDKGLKGCTTFRFNPEAFQGVLVKEDDLENTVYQFTLEDGSIVDLKGNETVEYDGESHTAANLYDALKEGYYGKF